MNVKLFAIFILIGFVGINSIGRYLMDEPMVRGEDFDMYLTLRNTAEKDIENAKVTLLIYDLGLIISSSNYDIDDASHSMVRISWFVPEGIPAGTYLTRIYAGNEYFKDTDHMFVKIV